MTAGNDVTEFLPGDGTMTRRILKRCKIGGLPFEVNSDWVKLGKKSYPRIISYKVPTEIYEEEAARRKKEKQLAEEKQKRKLAKLLASRKREQTEKLAVRYPLLSQPQIKKIVDSNKHVYSEDEIGYQFRIGTRRYWQQLGFAVAGNPTGISIDRKKIVDLYPASSLIPKKSRLSVKRLHKKLISRFGTDEIVAAYALRIANRLQKVTRNSEFYALKDRWIESNQHYLVEGKVARVEVKTCWACDGLNEDCDRCCGSGIYSRRTLYEHRFDVMGYSVDFHSYTKPKQISESRGEDLENYGRPFTEDELPCPPLSVLIELIKQLLGKDESNVGVPTKKQAT